MMFIKKMFYSLCCGKGCLQVENEAFLLVKLQAKRLPFSPLQFLCSMNLWKWHVPKLTSVIFWEHLG